MRIIFKFDNMHTSIKIENLVCFMVHINKTLNLTQTVTILDGCSMIQETVQLKKIKAGTW